MLPAPFVDTRGSIQNLLERPCGGVSIIRSRAGSERSNHYHREDGHWLYVLSGEMLYWEEPVAFADKLGNLPLGPALAGPPQIYNTGDMIYTGPMMWHRTRFPVDTVLISMNLRPRDHASHEEDVVRML